MAPRDDTLLYVKDELPGAQAWAERHRAPLVWAEEVLELRVTLTQPETKQPFYLRGRFDEYRELPPEWTFTDSAWTAATAFALFPNLAQTPYGSPLFIRANSGPVICAPFNRLAYAAHGGPHRDWTLAAWLAAGHESQVKAHCIGDMLQIIYRDVLLSRGRMA